MNAKEPQPLPTIVNNDGNLGAGYNGPRPSDDKREPAAPPPAPPPKAK